MKKFKNITIANSNRLSKSGVTFSKECLEDICKQENKKNLMITIGFDDKFKVGKARNVKFEDGKLKIDLIIYNMKSNGEYLYPCPMFNILEKKKSFATSDDEYTITKAVIMGIGLCKGTSNPDISRIKI